MNHAGVQMPQPAYKDNFRIFEVVVTKHYVRLFDVLGFHRGSVLSFAGFLPATWLSQVLMGLYSPCSKLFQETMGTNAG